MGTRNLTVVVLNKKVKVAQYGQWDGYLEGQGKTIMDFIKTRLVLPKAGLERFKEAVSECKFLTAAQIKQTWNECGADPNSDLVGMDVADAHSKKYPALSRDTGGKILQTILDGARELSNSIDFAGDSLFCEWAYVLDLDKQVLEIYNGFNKGPAKGRFAKMERHVPEHYKKLGKDYEYQPVTLFKKVKFADCTAAKLKELVKLASGEDEEEAS